MQAPQGRYPALSIVAPNATRIAQGLKTIEVRSWCPDQLPIKDLVIVENANFLSQNFPVETGRAVAMVDVEHVSRWQPDQVQAACASAWSEGYYAWQLSHVRVLTTPFETLAKRKIYFIDIDQL
jgi:hypothetical protein